MSGNVSEKVILLLAANPKKVTPLRLGDELREIRQSLRGARHRDQFRLEMVTSARQQDVRQALLDLKPHIVHFSGHGTKNEEIVVLADDGRPHFVGAAAVVPFFEIFRDHVRCVVLNSCHTQPLAEKISQHVDHVVGMKDAVQDEVALQYAVAFYDGLFAGESMENAHSLGVNAIRWANLPGHLNPVLHVAKGVSSSTLDEVSTSSEASRGPAANPREAAAPAAHVHIDRNSVIEGDSVANGAIVYGNVVNKPTYK